MKYICSLFQFFGIIFQFYYYFFVTEAARYECSYRRAAHHATEPNSNPNYLWKTVALTDFGYNGSWL